MLIEQIPSLLRGVYLGVTWRKSQHEKVIYLTFDDGPIPEVTPWVLDILDQYQIKATFFCVGENVMRYPEIYEDIIKRGHRTGNHTFNHKRGFFTDTRDYLDNVEKASQYINSDLFRPPHGEMRRAQLKFLRKNFKVIQWDVITRDYNQNLSEDKAFKIVKRYARNGSIIVFHDSLKAKKNMCYSMPKSIDFLLQKGYTFGVL
jgi:peptidoglycan-N-acetylglucosamine deacetylase